MAVRARRGELALLAAGLLVSFALAEGLVRLLGARPGGGGYAPVRTDWPERRPINSRGYRDVEHTRHPPAGVRRVVCLGDSFTWGVSVLFDDAWPKRLERGLARERGEEWEAIILAEPGLNAVQLTSRLDVEGFAYEPDVVVLAWVLNDAEDLDSAEARRAEDWVEESRREPSALESILDRSALVRLVRTRARATAQNRERIRNFRSLYADDYPGWSAARAALHTMGGLCRAKGVPLVVAIFPLFGNPLDERYPFEEEHAKVAQAAAAAGAKVVDLLPWYRGLRWETLVVDGARDEHPNEIAHRIAAQTLVRAVDEVVPRESNQSHP
ncbi:MAG: SGNH/GDSL hydrolase family protein [Acidobacteria bacterium]|nr:SGNH/GDSL hydrolase family protein [Acidobacteriota bacterium]